MVTYDNKNPSDTQRVSPGKRGDSSYHYIVALVFKPFDFISTAK